MNPYKMKTLLFRAGAIATVSLSGAAIAYGQGQGSSGSQTPKAQQCSTFGTQPGRRECLRAAVGLGQHQLKRQHAEPD